MGEDTSSTTIVILATTMGTDSWNIRLPNQVAVYRLIAKLVASPELPFREQDDQGRRIPYRLMWKQGSRYLNETETLEGVGVAPEDTLIMTHEARAGSPRLWWGDL